MQIPSLKIGELVAKYPIVQGAMGVGVSLSNLAASVANSGGIGVISGVQIGFDEPDFETNSYNANIRALKKHIRQAKEWSPDGIIGVNLMVAINNYKEMVKTCVEEKVDLIISGAGLPKNLPEYVLGSDTKIAPIVSSGKAAQLITKMWDKRYDYLPDMLIVEGPEAGGHLAYSQRDLEEGKSNELEQILTDVLAVSKEYWEKKNQYIPVIAAGGIYDGGDIAKYLKLGASGVQMATRFVTTDECDAHEKFKQTYIDSNSETIGIVKSPVGLPGRAVLNQFTATVSEKSIPVQNCHNCLQPCNPQDTDYCISAALINSVSGNVQEGLIFAGSNAHKTEEIVPVSELMTELVQETEKALEF